MKRHLTLYEQARERGESHDQALKLAFTAALVSPNFLFRDELGGEGEAFTLNDHQLASRLSYFLWMTMPDAELRGLADAGKLKEDATLKAQVRRMVADPKARAFTRTFLGQWLGFAGLGTEHVPDARKFRDFTPTLAEAMKLEPEEEQAASRVATFMSAHGFSRQNFTFLDGVKNDHHGMSHHKNQAALVREYTTVSRWYAQQVNYMVTKMRAIEEGNGSLLDNSVVLYGSEMKDGNGHIKNDLPLVLLGRGQGRLQTGQYLACPPAPRWPISTSPSPSSSAPKWTVLIMSAPGRSAGFLGED